MAGPLWRRLEGGCMRPLLRGGAAASIAPLGRRGARPGDVVLYRAGGKEFLHRVWWKTRDALWVKDDAGLVALHRIPRSAALGLVQLSSPLARGRAGLAFGLAATAVFTAGRAVKRLAGL